MGSDGNKRTQTCNINLCFDNPDTAWPSEIVGQDPTDLHDCIALKRIGFASTYQELIVVGGIGMFAGIQGRAFQKRIFGGPKGNYPQYNNSIMEFNITVFQEPWDYETFYDAMM